MSTAFAAELVSHDRFQFVHVVAAMVRQLMALRMAPALLDRIQFRAVGRQPLELKPIGMMRRVPCCRRTMCIQPVPNQDDLATDLMVQQSQKLDHLFLFEALLRQLKVQRHALAFGRQRQSANCRHATMVLGRRQLHRRLAARRPGALPIGLQQKARFVGENDASLLTRPPFLFAANRDESIAPQPRRFARAPGVAASGTTNPTSSASAKRGCRRTSPRSVVRSLRPPVDRSINRSRSQPSRLLVRESALHADIAPPSAATAAPDSAWPQVPRAPLCRVAASIDLRYSRMHSPAARLPRATYLEVTGYPQSVASPPIPLHCLWFSCRNYSAERQTDN
jgi:hypothetical protein